MSYGNVPLSLKIDWIPAFAGMTCFGLFQQAASGGAPMQDLSEHGMWAAPPWRTFSLLPILSETDDGGSPAEAKGFDNDIPPYLHLQTTTKPPQKNNKFAGNNKTAPLYKRHCQKVSYD